MARNVSETAFRVAFAVLLAPAAHSAPTVDVSWNFWAPVVVDRTITADPLNGLFVSITGQDEPHQGYRR